MRYIILLIGVLGLMSSCEDVIILDLDNAEAKLIIEAKMNMDSSTVEVFISESNGFYDVGQPIRLNVEEVRVKKEGDNWVTLEQQADGFYTITHFTVFPETVYEIEVDYKGTVYNASARAPHPISIVNIDTAAVSLPVGGGINYRLGIAWQDRGNELNYYRIKYAIDGIDQSNDISVYDDFTADGQLLIRPIRNPFDAGSQVKVTLQSIDEASYEYFRQLATTQAQGPNGAIPFNPQGNFDNGALGYFGIHSSDHREIQL